MAERIVVDVEAIQMAVDIMTSVEQEMDDVTSKLFFIRGASAEGWSGEAWERFSENCHKLREKGVEVTYNLRKNKENLCHAAGILIAKEQENQKMEQGLSADNIFV